MIVKRFLHTLDNDVMTRAEIWDHVLGVSVDVNPRLYQKEIDPTAIIDQVDKLQVGESVEMSRFSAFKRIK